MYLYFLYGVLIDSPVLPFSRRLHLRKLLGMTLMTLILIGLFFFISLYVPTESYIRTVPNEPEEKPLSMNFRTPFYFYLFFLLLMRWSCLVLSCIQRILYRMWGRDRKYPKGKFQEIFEAVNASMQHTCMHHFLVVIFVDPSREKMVALY